MVYDDQIYPLCDNDDLWVYDKLILSKKLGHISGPAGVPVPKAGVYVVRPITNIIGMGIGTRFMELKHDTNHIPEGCFWQELFRGDHYSIDFIYKQQDLTVQGIRDTVDDVRTWSSWEKVPHHYKPVDYPKELELKGRYPLIKVEMIGDKIIEVHLRCNPDFIGHKSDIVIPVYKEENKLKEGFKFISRPDDKRLGFLIKE